MLTKKMFTIIISLAIAVIGACVVYFFVLRRANPPLKSGEIKIGDSMFSTEIASTTMEQARGLSFRQSLPEGHGMLFTFSKPAVQSFWMKDMNFPIDMIWIGPSSTSSDNAPASSKEIVLGFVENAPPLKETPLWSLPIYSSPDGTDMVLEVNAGVVAKDNIRVGDEVIAD